MTGGLGPALLHLVDVGPARAAPEMRQERFELLTRTLGDDLNGAAVRKVAYVAGKAEGSCAPLHEVAKTDTLHAATGKGLKADRFAVTCHVAPDV